MMGTSTFENIVEKTNVSANEVHSTLAKKMLVDGFDFVLDIKRSRDLTLVDEKTGDEYLDFFSFFASSPLGMNHPKLDTPEFREELAIASLNKPSNSDIYTTQMANFVETFSRVAVPDCRGGSGDVCNCCRIVARRGAVLVLIGVNEGRDIAEVVGEILDLGAVDQFLTLQHAAEQQADDNQHNGDLDQGEAGLLVAHLRSPLLLRV